MKSLSRKKADRALGRLDGSIQTLPHPDLFVAMYVRKEAVLYLSHYFRRHRQQYYENPRAVRDAGGWVQWLVFFLTGVFEVSQRATETVWKILSVRERHRQLITDEFSRAAGNSHRVLQHLYRHPIVAVTEVRNLIETSYPAANNLVSQFVTYGMLQEMTDQKRNRRFIYRNYIDFFHDDARGRAVP